MPYNPIDAVSVVTFDVGSNDFLCDMFLKKKNAKDVSIL